MNEGTQQGFCTSFLPQIKLKVYNHHQCTNLRKLENAKFMIKYYNISAVADMLQKGFVLLLLLQRELVTGGSSDIAIYPIIHSKLKKL